MGIVGQVSNLSCLDRTGWKPVYFFGASITSRTRSLPTGTAPKNPNSISSVVCSPNVTDCGGVRGLFGFFAELSNTASISNRVPAFATIGFASQYDSCQL